MRHLLSAGDLSLSEITEILEAARDAGPATEVLDLRDNSNRLA